MAGIVSSNFTVEVGDRELKFHIPLFSGTGEYENVEKYLEIDLGNLVGELITTPIIMKRLGALQVEAEDNTVKAKLEYEIWCAKKVKLFREKRASEGGKSPTKPECDEYILLHKFREKYQNRVFEAQKTEKYVNSLYWSFKEKTENLKKLSLTLQEGDLDEFTVEEALKRLNYVKGLNKRG